MARNKKKNKFLSLFVEEVDDYGNSSDGYYDDYEDDYDDYYQDEPDYSKSKNSVKQNKANNNQSAADVYYQNDSDYSYSRSSTKQSDISYNTNSDDVYQDYSDSKTSSKNDYQNYDDNYDSSDVYDEDYYDREFDDEEEKPKGLFGKLKAKIKKMDEEIDDELDDEYYDEYDDDKPKGLFGRLKAKFKKSDDDYEDYYDDIDESKDYSDDKKSKEEEPLHHLFKDEELEYSEEQDLLDADKLVWNDGEHVVSEKDLLSESDKVDNGHSYTVSDIPEELYTPEEVDLNESDDDDDEPSSEPSEKFSGRTRIFRPNGNKVAFHFPSEDEEKNDDENEDDPIDDEAELEKERELEHKRKVRKKKISNFFKNMSINVLFGIFLFVCLIAALYYTFLLSDIIVTGNDQYTTDYIVDLSGLKLGEHVFFMDLDETKANIQSNPYLEVKDITYIFPSRVRINVNERQEAAGILGLDYNVIIDKDGFVLSMSGSTDISNLLQVTGISTTGIKLGERIGETSDFSTATLISIMKKLEEYELSSYIKSLDLTTPLAIVMYTNNGFKIFIGQPTDLDKKFTSLQKLLPKFQAAGITTGTLYLSAKGGTVYSPISNPVAPTPETETVPEGTEITGEGITEGTIPVDPNTGELLTPTPEPSPTPVPIQPGGGDDFQG